MTLTMPTPKDIKSMRNAKYAKAVKIRQALVEQYMKQARDNQTRKEFNQ